MGFNSGFKGLKEDRTSAEC